MGADLDAIEKDLTADWRNNNRAAWLDRHRRAATEARRTATEDVERPTEPHPAAAAALWESAREIADLRGLPSAEPLLRDVLYRDPAHSGAGVLLGYHLLNIGDPDGESLLWQVVERADQGWVGKAYQALQDHYRSTGQTERFLHSFKQIVIRFHLGWPVEAHRHGIPPLLSGRCGSFGPA
jgi:hypothetical protein